jgi:hypothetical protein
MFTAITNALANGYIPRENVIALVTDDAGTMLGKVSGLYVRHYLHTKNSLSGYFLGKKHDQLLE